MAVTSGFFSSILNNGTPDRLYNAEQMSGIFEGIITDGVYQNVGDAFAVTPVIGSTDREINVKTGRAWFNKVWIRNSSTKVIALPSLSGSNQKRKDTIVFQIDKSNSGRQADIVYKTGTVSSSSTSDDELEVATLLDGTGIYQPEVYEYPLAYVIVRGKTGEISPSDIEYLPGHDNRCKFVTAPLVNINVGAYLDMMLAQFQFWFAHSQTTVTSWMDGSGNRISGEVIATRLTALEELYESLPKIYNGTIDPSSDDFANTLALMNEGDVYIYIPE